MTGPPELSATLRHELRAPMSVAAGIAETLREDHASELSPDAVALIDQLVHVLERAQLLIGALGALHAGDSTAGQLFSLEDALEEACNDLSAELEETGAVVLAGPLPVVVADRALLTQVLRNLIENAVRYNPAPHPRVEVIARPAGSVTEVMVVDNGPGLPEGDEERIFERGVRGGRFERAEGTGIGLDVCRQIVTTWGGNIRAETGPQGGAVFRFSVPLAPPASNGR